MLRRESRKDSDRPVARAREEHGRGLHLPKRSRPNEIPELAYKRLKSEKKCVADARSWVMGKPPCKRGADCPHAHFLSADDVMTFCHMPK